MYIEWSKQKLSTIDTNGVDAVDKAKHKVHGHDLQDLWHLEPPRVKTSIATMCCQDGHKCAQSDPRKVPK